MVVSQGSVWEIAITDARKQRATGEETGNDKAPRQATILFVGVRGSGKTTIIQRFLDREETPKPTLALEYTYARMSGKTLAKDVCHIWELGGGAMFTTLLSNPINHRSLNSLTIFLVLDLSKPEKIWNHLELLFKDIKERINDVVTSQEGQSLKLQTSLTEAAWNRIGSDHQDKDTIHPCLVPLVIIGGKYDLFEEMEPDSKKIICRALRFIAHVNGASLFFFSSKESGLVKKVKELQSQYGFGTSESKSLAQDYNKPLIIPAGSDSLSFISGMVDGDTKSMSYEHWKQAFTSKFPQEDKMASSVPGDPSRDPHYAEPDVDNLRAQKDQELEKLRREVGIEARPKSTRRRQAV